MIFTCLIFNTLGLHNQQLIFDWANRPALSELMKYAAVQKYILFGVNVGSFPLDTWNYSLLSSQLDYSPCRDTNIHFIF